MKWSAPSLGRVLHALVVLAVLAFLAVPLAFLWTVVPPPYAQLTYLAAGLAAGLLIRWSFTPLIGRRLASVGGAVVGVLPVLFGIFATVGMYYPGILEIPPSEREQEETIALLKAQVQEEMGPDLDYVEVRYGRDGHKPAYFGELALQDVPLKFTFQAWASELDEPGLQQNPPFPTETAGGRDRFVKLARQFHQDFPDGASMDYVPLADVSHASQVMGRDLSEYAGPFVLVREADLYQSDELRPFIGLYSWNESRQEWMLVHRGEIEY
jgi:hypothetical protein